MIDFQRKDGLVFASIPAIDCPNFSSWLSKYGLTRDDVKHIKIS